MPIKPKTNRAGNVAVSLQMDCCQTPMYALDPIIPYLSREYVIWEPAKGEGNLYHGLMKAGYPHVIGSDVQSGTNFFEYEPSVEYDYIVTNPPYSIKYPWIARCYELGKPFALLLPIDTVGAAKAQKFFKEFGVEIIYLNRRINFKMPNKGYEGSAQFATAWFTWGLSIGKQISFANIDRCTDEEWLEKQE